MQIGTSRPTSPLCAAVGTAARVAMSANNARKTILNAERAGMDDALAASGQQIVNAGESYFLQRRNDLVRWRSSAVRPELVEGLCFFRGRQGRASTSSGRTGRGGPQKNRRRLVFGGTAGNHSFARSVGGSGLDRLRLAALLARLFRRGG